MDREVDVVLGDSSLSASPHLSLRVARELDFLTLVLGSGVQCGLVCHTSTMDSRPALLAPRRGGCRGAPGVFPPSPDNLHGRLCDLH